MAKSPGMPKLLNGIDFSFGAEHITPAWCNAQIREGYRIAVACLWTGNGSPRFTEQALSYWRDAGGIIAGYISVHDDAAADWHLKQGAKAAGSLWEKLNFVAVDVELPGTTMPVIENSVNQLKDLGRRPALYTGFGKWSEIFGRDISLMGGTVPLWDASWGIEPSMEMNLLYGGWTSRIGHQYRGDTELDGILVDFNVFDEEWILAGEGVQPQLSTLDTAINVNTGWGKRFSELASMEGLDLDADIRELLRQGGFEISDVARLLREYKEGRRS